MDSQYISNDELPSFQHASFPPSFSQPPSLLTSASHRATSDIHGQKKKANIKQKTLCDYQYRRIWWWSKARVKQERLDTFTSGYNLTYSWTARCYFVSPNSTLCCSPLRGYCLRCCVGTTIRDCRPSAFQPLPFTSSIAPSFYLSVSFVFAVLPLFRHLHRLTNQSWSS